MTTNRQILFVDDEPEYLTLLQGILQPAEPGWEMKFASGGLQALEMMNRTRFDVVVTDMCMPEMDGAELLQEIMRRSPQTMRIIVSGRLDRENILRLTIPTHQCLAKPLNPDQLKLTLRRICSLRDLLANETLRRLVTQLSLLPTVPTLYLELVRELQSAEPSPERATEVIAKDPAMTAKILQLINSAFFGLPRQLDNLGEAVSYVGLELITALVLCVPVFSRFDTVRVKDFSPTSIWEHSWRAGVLARQIATAEQQEQAVCEQSFLAGLLHDVGKLVLIANLPTLCREAAALKQKNQVPLHAAEQEIFGCTHAEVGAYLLGLWGLPESIVEAVALHDRPKDSPTNVFSPLTAVHVANAMDHAMEAGPSKGLLDFVDLEYLISIGLHGRLEVWQQKCQTAFERQQKA